MIDFGLSCLGIAKKYQSWSDPLSLALRNWILDTAAKPSVEAINELYQRILRDPFSGTTLKKPLLLHKQWTIEEWCWQEAKSLLKGECPFEEGACDATIHLFAQEILALPHSEAAVSLQRIALTEQEKQNPSLCALRIAMYRETASDAMERAFWIRAHDRLKKTASKIDGVTAAFKAWVKGVAKFRSTVDEQLFSKAQDEQQQMQAAHRQSEQTLQQEVGALTQVVQEKKEHVAKLQERKEGLQARVLGAQREQAQLARDIANHDTGGGGCSIM